MKPKLLIFLLLFSFQLYASTDSLDIKKINRSGAGYKINVSGNIIGNTYPNNETYRIVANFWVPWLKKSNLGIEAGYYNISSRPNRNVSYSSKHDLFLGFAFRYQFYKQSATPFFGVHCLLDYSADYNLNKPLEVYDNIWTIGSSYLLDIGYAYKFPRSSWGIEASYSIGISFNKNFYEVNYSSYSLGNYYSIEKYYFREGLNFLKIGINYYF